MSVKDKTINLAGAVTVKDFAGLLDMSVSDVIKELMGNGILATINEELDYETAVIIAEDLGYRVKKKKGEDVEVLSKEAERRSRLKKLLAESDKANTKKRSPIITVMGHVDHGKTSLLDAIRQTNVTAGEAGGITQHIGAYQVEKKGRMITFLDTPGHEAFTAMRARGADVTDIAVLVVAVDDGVKPQTIEAIDHAKAAGVPIVVAINKIDKEGANSEKVKKELSEHGVVTEEWGGDNVCVEVSAKKMINIDELLDMILLVADMLDIAANPRRTAVGTVIEVDKTEREGAVSTILVQTGTLHIGDDIVVGTTFGKVRSMKNYRGRDILEAGPSVPVRLTGLKDVPHVGDILEVHASIKEARLRAEKRSGIERLKSLKGYGKFGLAEMAEAISKGKMKKLNVVVKADVDGTLEAIASSLDKLKSKEAGVQILHRGVGNISESDVMMAKASSGVIVGFNVKVESDAQETATAAGIQIKIYNIIYELIDDLKHVLEGLLEPEKIEVRLAKVKILAVFKHGKKDMIIGGKVLNGKVEKGDDVCVRLVRDKKEVSSGKLVELQCEKQNVDEVSRGKEAGMRVEGVEGVEEGDIVEVYRIEMKKKKL